MARVKTDGVQTEEEEEERREEERGEEVFFFSSSCHRQGREKKKKKPSPQTVPLCLGVRGPQSTVIAELCKAVVRVVY